MGCMASHESSGQHSIKQAKSTDAIRVVEGYEELVNDMVVTPREVRGEWWVKSELSERGDDLQLVQQNLHIR